MLTKLVSMNYEILSKLKGILNAQDESAFIVDLLTSKILLANTLACKTLGYSINELASFSLNTVISENFREIIFNVKDKNKISKELCQFITNSGYSFIAGTTKQKILIGRKNYQLISFQNLASLADTSEIKKNADKEFFDFFWKLFLVNQQITNVNRDMFFKNLVYSLANAMNMRWVMICLLLPPSRKEVKVVSLWDKSDFENEFVYELKGTPCEKVVQFNKPYFCENNLSKIFPKDFLTQQMGVKSYLGVPIFSKRNETIGSLIAMNDIPIKNSKRLRHSALMQFFSDRISNEIDLNISDSHMVEKEAFNKVLKSHPGLEKLSKRELEVLKYVNSGLTSKSIAEKMPITLPTVKFHLKNIYKKFGVTGRNGLLGIYGSMA